MFWCCPGKAAAFLAVELASSASTGLVVRAEPHRHAAGLPRLKLDFLRRQVLMSRNVSGGRFMSILMGGLN